jgi:hypothetical protein
VSAAGLANPTFMAIAAKAPDTAASSATASRSASRAASPRGPNTHSAQHTASSNTSSTMRAMGSGQLGISAAGIIAPLRSSDYGTLHRDYTADHSNSSSLAGEGMPASWGRHRRWPSSQAVAGPDVAATAEEPREEPAAGSLYEEDSAAGEPQFWLSRLPERPQHDYSYDSSAGSVSAAADSVQPVLLEGLSQWPSSVFQPGDYGYAPSRQGSESCPAAAAAAAEAESQGHLQQHEMVERAAGGVQQWQQQQITQQQQHQPMSAQEQELLDLEETSEGDSEGVHQQHPEELARRGSAAGAAMAAAGAAASAAFGGLKNMLGELRCSCCCCCCCCYCCLHACLLC